MNYPVVHCLSETIEIENKLRKLGGSKFRDILFNQYVMRVPKCNIFFLMYGEKYHHNRLLDTPYNTIV